MGWENDFPIEILSRQAKSNNKKNLCDEILHYIKINPNCTVSEVRKFIIKIRYNKDDI